MGYHGSLENKESYDRTESKNKLAMLQL